MDSEENKMNIFERASRRKLRISPTLAVEDLWDFNVNDLNKIYIEIYSEFEEKSNKGLMVKKDDAIEDIRLRLAIIKYIYEAKLKDTAKEIKELEKLEKRKEIEEIISSMNDLDTNNILLSHLINILKDFI
jgi:hypothetical protein